MKYYDVPVISGSVEEQIEQIKNYLYLQHEQLNYNLTQQSAEKVFQQAKAALVNASSPIESEQVKSEYQAFRDLIIGTATEAFKAGDTMSETLRQIEVYRSDFGTFREEITRRVDATAQATQDNYTYIGEVKTAAYNYTDGAYAAAENAAGAASAAQSTADGAASDASNAISSASAAQSAAENAQKTADNAASAAGSAQSKADSAASDASSAISAASTAQSTADNAASEIKSYKLEMENYINTGYLDTSATPPIFGIEVGMLKETYTATLNGETVTITSTPEKIRITPGRIGFWSQQGSNMIEAAYITQGAVYFPNAQITGGSIQIGTASDEHRPFEVDSNGNLYAKGATISGTITAGSGSTIGGWTIGSDAIYRGSETYGNANTLYFGSSGLSIKDKFKVSSSGVLEASGAKIQSGSWIGRWYIDSNYLYCQTSDWGTSKTNVPIFICSTGISCPDGSISANNLNISSGSSGNQNGTLMQGGTTRIDSSGNGIFASLKIGSTTRIDSTGNGLFLDISGSSLTINTDKASIASNGQATFKSVDAGSGTIQTTGSVTAGSVSATTISATLSITAASLTCSGAVSGGAATFSSLNAGSGTIKTTGAVDFVTLKHNGTEILKSESQLSGTKSITKSTWTSIVTKTIGKGTWIVYGYVSFANNANGDRVAIISSSSTVSGIPTTGDGATSCKACEWTGTALNVTKVITVSTSTTYYLWVYQNCGSTLNCSGGIQVFSVA